MALIKCPECQREVSTSAEACPHCGFPIKQSLNVEKSDAPKPLEESWMDYWRLAPKKRKLILSFIYAAHLVVMFILFCFMGAVENGILAALITWEFIVGFFSVISLVVMITGFICIKTRTSKCDDYNVVAFSGIWNNYLVIENKLFDKTHNRHLEGNLPNGKRVTADFALWDNSITISFDK